MSQEIRIYGEVPDSIVDGPGLRYSVFVQGCSHGCPGCHNPESHAPDGGTLSTVDEVFARIRANGLVHDVTLSGGDPFEQAEACAELAERLKAEGYGVWAYTGYLYEDLAARAAACDRCQSPVTDSEAIARLLAAIDVLVDGPFVEALQSYTLKWRGSSNQRLIDMAKTRAAGEIVLWENEQYVLQKPPSW